MPHQVSVFAENKPGKISRITKALKKEEIDIRAITISDAGDYGIIKLLLDRPADGMDCLIAEGIAATLKDIVAIKVKDQPGGLLNISEILFEKNINVEDAYGFSIKHSDMGIFVFQVENVQGTENILRDSGFEIIEDSDLYLL